MSSRKPRRNLRTRGGDSDDGEENEEERQRISGSGKSAVKPVKGSLLSFEEDLNEGDDGEVFKVKKSTQSKKIRKLLDKERKKKKDKPTAEPPAEAQDKPQQPIDEDIVIKLKNTFPILNGREAEAAVQEGISSEDESDSGPVHKFTNRRQTQFVIEHGKIPDAATIHAARKQRQQRREMGEVVPLPDEPNRFENSKSRLIREDDNDASDGDDEERIKMTVNLVAEDRIRRKAEFEAAQHIDSEESEKGEDEEWEAQQIRKGVTGAQIAAVQQESMFYQQYLNPVPQETGEESHVDLSQSIPPSLGTIEPNVVISKLKQRLSELKDVHRKHVREKETACEEMNSLEEDTEQLKKNTPRLADRFRFYQDLRGYVTDLVDCLDEKVLVVDLLEARVEAFHGQRVTEIMARRRQDVADQCYELLPSNSKTRVEKDEAQVRRIAEREGRRIRRQRVRELSGITSHSEGMSSDEEMTETEQVTARAQIDVIEQDAKHIFDDVLDEFSTIPGILRRFEEWRRADMDAYTEAYVSLCLPKLLGPFIRLNLLFWNPLVQGNPDFEKSSWCHNLLLYGFDIEETEEWLKKDPDIQLLPRVIEKVLLPKLTQLVTLSWDPLSSSQTVSLVTLVTKLLQDYPTVSHSSKFLNNLLSAVHDRMKNAVENDVYIPIYTKQRMSEGRVLSFFLRQVTVAVKLLGNFVRWQGILSDSVLSSIALDSLLNRYLVMAIRNCPPMQAANICQMVGNVLPRVWLQVCVHPPQLTLFLNEARKVAKQLDTDKPLERDALERMANILKAIS